MTETRMTLPGTDVPAYRTYKDRVFRMLFGKKKRLLELYNALNHSDYTDDTELTVNTLENAIFIKMKNDISFIIDSNMSLYEHQSSWCPNMPLRGFFYFADLYKKLIAGADLSTYSRIWIPTPHYIVFYNGMDHIGEEFEQKLSESFEDQSEGCMELTVRVININYGYNRELMEKCQPLCDYAYFVAAIRRNLNKLPMEQAVKASVEECIEKDILREFLLEQKAEVIAMSIYEYNEEYVRKDFYESGVQEGYSQGMEEGYGRGMQEGKTLEIIAFIRKMSTRNMKAEEIADYTEKDPKEIQLILELIETNPEADNQQISSMLKKEIAKKEL